MKKLVMLCAAVCASIVLTAQINANSWVLMGGGGYFQNSTDNQNGSSNFKTISQQGWIDFGGMYLFTDNIGAGINLNVNNSVFKADDKKQSSTNTFGVTLLGRWYSPCMAPRFYAFGQVDIGFASGSRKDYDDDGNEVEDNRDNISQFGFGIRPGIAYFLTPAIMLEASFGALAWNQQTATNNANSDLKTIQNSMEFFAFSKTLTFGFCWWIGRGGAGF